jgi:hypothetical protein
MDDNLFSTQIKSIKKIQKKEVKNVKRSVEDPDSGGKKTQTSSANDG